MLFFATFMFFVLSFLNGAWSKTSSKTVSFGERLVCLLCGATSIVIGLVFGVFVLFLMADGGEVVVKGFFQTWALIFGACIPGLLGLWAASWVKKKTAYLDAESASARE
jgi:hypothetical protein